MNAAPRSLAMALASAGSMGLDRLDAQLLLGHLLAKPRTWLITHDETLLDADLDARYLALCARRAAGEPVAYLVGEREFHGLSLQVSAAVLVPRPDTETLVDWALELLAGELAGRPAPAVVDLGTGSGAIALAVKHACPRCRMTALDNSPDALAQARANGERLAIPVDFRAGDWWSAVESLPHFDLALSNPPYIAGNDPHLAALVHEPLQALTPGGDGLDAIRHIVSGARAHLVADGWLLIEHGWDQAEAVRSLLDEAGFEQVGSRRDLAGHPRCTGGRMTRRGCA